MPANKAEPKLSMSQFLSYLRQQCTEAINGTNIMLSYDVAKVDAYKHILGMIDLFLEKYSAQKTMTRQAEQNWYESIETSRRRGFDNPDELICHIRDIASRQAFFDCEGISLAAINAFCNDYINKGESK